MESLPIPISIPISIPIKAVPNEAVVDTGYPPRVEMTPLTTALSPVAEWNSR